MANGKAKGGSFERDIARTLTKWCSGQDKELWFWRSPSSGGLATISEQLNMTGDIISVRPEGHFLTNKFSIEIKTGYEDTCFFSHLKNIKNFNIEMFWKQCCSDAEKSYKEPVLIYRKKGINPIIGFRYKYVKLSSKFLSKDMQSLIVSFNSNKKLPEVIFFNMNEFFEKVTKDEI